MSMVKESGAIYFVLTVFRQQILPSLLAISSQQALTDNEIEMPMFILFISVIVCVLLDCRQICASCFIIVL